MLAKRTKERCCRHERQPPKGHLDRQNSDIYQESTVSAELLVRFDQARPKPHFHRIPENVTHQETTCWKFAFHCRVRPGGELALAGKPVPPPPLPPVRYRIKYPQLPANYNPDMYLTVEGITSPFWTIMASASGRNLYGFGRPLCCFFCMTQPWTRTRPLI